jgi:L-threonylcarbamoyladenylate synthase
MKVFSLQSDGKLSKADRDEIITFLDNHGVVVMPTDTSYGLAAKITDKQAIKKIYQLKKREATKTLSMAVSGRAQALKYGVVSCKPTSLWKAFMPGPLTLVVWAKGKAIPFITRKDKTVAIRQVPTPVVQQILRSLSVPITITSANRSARNDIYTLTAFKKQHGSKLPVAFIDAGTLKKVKPSTIVSALKGEEVAVLRDGPIKSKQIKQALSKH